MQLTVDCKSTTQLTNHQSSTILFCSSSLHTSISINYLPIHSQLVKGANVMSSWLCNPII